MESMPGVVVVAPHTALCRAFCPFWCGGKPVRIAALLGEQEETTV